MQERQPRHTYDLKLTELFGVAAFVGCGHYAASLIHDFSAASTLSSALQSANVGITAAVGVVAYSAYRFFRPKAPCVGTPGGGSPERI